MGLESDILEKAKLWCKYDPNPSTASYVTNLITQATSDEEKTESGCAATNELKSLFPVDGSRISFGTAGLRSSMTPGPLGMNDLVVIQAAQGIAKYVMQHNPSLPVTGKDGNDDEIVNPPKKQKKEQKLRAVIGYDHRENPSLQLSSLSFAIWTVLVFEEAGIDSILLDGFVATPLVPFVMSRTENAVVGIMVTASHNPKDDNGYKVYWKDACQIRPPLDTGISDEILKNLIPWVDYSAALLAQKEKFGRTTAKTESSSHCLGLSNPEETKRMISSYFDAIKSSGLITSQSKLLSKSQNPKEASDWRPPSFAYTAMHGIGHNFAKQVFDTFGFPSFQEVAVQCKPDASFPTVNFPNPEEKGALDIAKAIAEEKGCDIILANDPDADRLAVAEREKESGEWTIFTGDQIGAMLGHWIWEKIGKTSDKPVAMCASAVSSQMLREIARVEGFHFEDTHTGFKWIGSRASQLNQEKYRVLFCYEEAIGFCCGNSIFDKDGISALGVFAELTYSVYNEGLDLVKHMQRLYNKYGEFVSNNGYYIMNDHGAVGKIMDVMTCRGKFNLSSVGPYQIESFRYLGEPGYDSSKPDKKPTMATSKSSPMVSIRFKNGCIAQFRPSGTEPKFKYYIELQGTPGTKRATVEKNLMEMSETILEELLQPRIHGLRVP